MFDLKHVGDAIYLTIMPTVRLFKILLENVI